MDALLANCAKTDVALPELLSLQPMMYDKAMSTRSSAAQVGTARGVRISIKRACFSSACNE